MTRPSCGTLWTDDPDKDQLMNKIFQALSSELPDLLHGDSKRGVQVLINISPGGTSASIQVPKVIDVP